MIYINGNDLTIEQVIAVSRQGETVAIAPDARERINAARAYVDRKLADKAVVYGLTTGFGKFSTVFVPEEETAQLQRNLIISHACGMGEPLDTRVVRAAMLLRLNALARGNSGIRLSTMETLLQMLNRGVHPIIPEKGSLGASGDLAPLSHMVLVMLGEGEAEYQRRLLEGSGLSFDLNPDKVQDAYAIRCTPQIHGASRDAIGYVWGVVSREINAVTDNPLIFPEEDEAISGGNFHGQPVALAMDFLGIALAEYANVSERRLERLVNPALSEGLPAFLTNRGGVHSGFMIAQYAAASMVSESKVYAHPASVDSIPSSANQEDHVSMGTTAARKALMILDNSQKVLGIELFAGAQAAWLRGEDGLSPATRAVYDRIRQAIPPVDQDVVMHPLMVQADELVKAHAISQAAEAVCGELQ